MSATYNHRQKEKLAERIQTLKKKKDLIRVVNLIMEDPIIQEKMSRPEEMPYTENSNGMFMFFHILTEPTYQRLEEEMNKLDQKKKPKTDPSSEARDYRPYYHDEFPSERHMSPKLRYSNREKNLMKRRKYNREINEEEEYCEFKVSMLTEDSERVNSESVQTSRSEEATTPMTPKKTTPPVSPQKTAKSAPKKPRTRKTKTPAKN